MSRGSRPPCSARCASIGLGVSASRRWSANTLAAQLSVDVDDERFQDIDLRMGFEECPGVSDGISHAAGTAPRYSSSQALR